MILRLIGRIPLRLLLTLIITSLVLVTTALTGWISFRNGEQMVWDLNLSLHDQAEGQVTQYLSTYLKSAHQANQAGLTALQSGIILPEQPDQMVNYFWRQGKIFQGISTLAYATVDGNYLGANYPENYAVLANASLDGVIRRYALDAKGWRTNTVLVERSGYDPRNRAWYQAAVSAEGAAWAGINASATGPRLDLTAVQPVYDDGHNLLGVLMVDISLANLGAYLADLNTEVNYDVIIIDDQGMLVATSLDEQPYVIDQNGLVTRLRAVDSSNPLLVEAVQNYLGDQSAAQHAFYPLSLSRGNSILSGSELFYLSTDKFNDDFGLNWNIVILMPETPLMARIYLANQLSLVLILASGLAAAVLGWWAATWFVRPVTELSRAAHALALGNWDQPLRLSRRDELGQLTRAFITMRSSLSRSIKELEAEVQERHRVEIQLRNERDLFSRLMDTSLIGLLEYGPDLTIGFANGRAEQILRLDKDDHGRFTMPSHRILDGHGRSLLADEFPISLVAKSLEPVSGVRVTFEWSDHHQTHALMNASPVFGEGEKLENIVASVEDITERHQAQMALLESETRFRTLVRNLSVGVMLYGAQGEVLLMNLAASEILGISQQIATSKAGPDTKPIYLDERGEPIPETAMPVTQTLATGQPVRNKVIGRVNSQSGKTVWLQFDALPQFAVDGSIRQVLCVFSDITVRRRAEDWLRAVVAGTAGEFGHEFFNSLVKHLAVALETQYAFIGELDRPGHIRVLAFWSGSNFGNPFEYNLEGTPCAQVISQDICLYMQGVQEQFPTDSGLKRMNIESYMGVPLFDSAHHTLGLLVVMDKRPMSDVQERRSILTVFAARAGGEMERLKTEQQIRQLNAELEERVARRTRQLEAANSEMEAFAYSVSHDLRAPLRSVEGFGRILSEDYGSSLGDEGQMYLRRILNATQRMTEMTDSLLKLSRLSRAELKIIDIDLSQIAVALLNDLHDQHPGRLITFEVAPHMHTRGDPVLLEIMLHNLLLNAWKFTGKQPSPFIEVGEKQIGRERVFYVKDNGVGFDMTYAQDLFAPFQRLHSANDFEGTGIGLATVKRIMVRHGGRIWAESIPDEGATFYFVLPETH